MYTIRLMNEFLHGPIWIYDQNEFIRLKHHLITNDSVIIKLNEDAAELYDSFFNFTQDDKPYYFDKNEYQKAFPKMRELIEKIKQRLDEINDGSFTVEDYITNQKFD